MSKNREYRIAIRYLPNSALYKRYVDDQDIVLEVVRVGERFVEESGEMEWRREWEELDLSLIHI